MQNAASVPRTRRTSHGKPIISKELEETYRFAHLIRLTETLLLDLFTQGLLSGTTHTCLGQELCQMGVVRALDDPDDAVLSNHRNHGHFLTYSGDFLGLIAEIMGREAGVCGGIGGSQHLAFRHFHSNGVQAGMTAIAVGQALARKRRGSTGIVAVIVGDGTLGQGLLYESMNLASIWRLPLLFVVENNTIAQTTPTSTTIGGEIEARGKAFGLKTWRLDDAQADFLSSVEDAVASVRLGAGPGFLVIDTKRMGPHSKGDDLRDPEEMESIRFRDPLMRIARELPASTRADIEAENQALLQDVRASAEASPEASRLVAESSVYRPSTNREYREPRTGGNVRAQLNAAIDDLLGEFPEVIVLGEDLHEPYGGAFKVTAGLSTKHPERVISTPISEAGVIGTGIGLAIAGYRPIVEIMFADFVTLGMDQIYNHAVKFPGMFADVQVPLVIRTPSGGRRGYGPTHSQSTESLMSAVPGLTVVYPSHRHAVGRLLKNAVVRWPNPTIFFEHKLLYGEAAEPGRYRALASRDTGTDLFPTLVQQTDRDPDLTIVCYGGLVPVVEKFVEELQEEEVAVEIVAPALLSPLPRQELLGHLMERRRIAVFEESCAESGLGTMLGAALAEAGYTGRFRRLNTAPVPIPAARSLETRIIPGRREMLDAVANLLLRS
jgi:2-oxoisovalerate dehydrogenase E1 component